MGRGLALGAAAVLLAMAGRSAGAQPPARRGTFDVRDPAFAGGAKGDYNPATGAGADDTGAIQAAIDAAADANGGVVAFPPGFYKVSALTVANAFHDPNARSTVTLQGANEGNTVLYASRPSGDVISVVSPSVRIERLGFRPVVDPADPQRPARRASGAYVHFTGTSMLVSIDHFSMQGGYEGIRLSAGSTNRISNGFIMDTAPAAGPEVQSAGIVIGRGRDAKGNVFSPQDNYIRNVTMTVSRASPHPAEQPFAGIWARSTDVLNITDCDIINHGRSLYLTADEGGVSGIYSSNTYYDSALYGVCIVAASNPVFACQFSNCWMSNHARAGILVDSNPAKPPSGPPNLISFHGCHVLLNGRAGDDRAGGENVAGAIFNNCRNVTVDACQFANNRVNSIQLGPRADAFHITDNKVGDARLLNALPVTGAGIIGPSPGGLFLFPGSDNHVITGNNFQGSKASILRTAPLFQSRLRDNIGFNPVGPLGPLAPAMPASGVRVRNPSGVDCTVYLVPGTQGLTTLEEIQIVGAGSALTLPMATFGPYRVPAGAAISLRYSGAAPRWAWVGE